MESRIRLSNRLFLVYLITALILQVAKAELVTKVQNIFQDRVNVHRGDVMLCEITKTNIKENNANDFYVYTAENREPFSPTQYQFHPVTKKCFSFKVRAAIFAHIAISSTPSIFANQRLEVILEHNDEYHKFSTIREITDKTVYLSKYVATGIIIDIEYKGFWIRMLDDHLLEVGREFETVPFLQYRFENERQLNYFAVMTVNTKGSWIINGDSKCPNRHHHHHHTHLKSTAESDCFLLHLNNYFKNHENN